jgi:hypothetical protein
MTIHNEIIRDAFREFGGYEVRSDGDSFMLAFSSAKDACSFSVKVTETLLEVTEREALIQPILILSLTDQMESGVNGEVGRRK